MVGTGGVESCVVVLSTYHNSELGFVELPRFIKLLKSFHDMEKFFLLDELELDL